MDKAEKYEEDELLLDQTPADMVFHEYRLKDTSPPVYINRATNLTPVNNLVNKLERVLETEENRKNRAWNDITSDFLETTKEMDKEQLRYVIVNLYGMVAKWASLYQSTLDNPEKHLKFVQEYRELEKMMGECVKHERRKG